jgi:hypothetical protein
MTRITTLFAIGLLRSSAMIAATIVLITMAEALSMMNQVRREQN